MSSLSLAEKAVEQNSGSVMSGGWWISLKKGE